MDEQAFLACVTKTDDCWVWTRAKTAAGYGIFTRNSKAFYAHHQAWSLWKTPNLPAVIRHKCRNRHCVNPDHLEGGTQKENMKDRERDKTDNKGERHGNHTLTEENVIEMRRLRREGARVDELQARYNLGTHSAVLYALTGETWSHVPGALTADEMKETRHHKKGKLTEEQIADIRRRVADGVSKAHLAREYGVSATTIANNC